MDKKLALLIALAAIVALSLAAFFLLGVRPSVKPVSLEVISMPPGFKIGVFADNLGGSAVAYPGPNPGPRMMLVRGNVLLVSIPSQGRVVALPYENGSGKADRAITFIDGLNNPHGVDFYDGWFYIGEETRIIRVRENGTTLTADRSTLAVLVGNLTTGDHYTKTVKIHNDSLYFSAGSPCNVCYEPDPMRAAITKCNLDGTGCKTFAKGLRNAVGFVFHPITGQMYATDNGRDWLGDNLPPDEINLVEEGKNYGWPICYGKNVHDTDFDKNVYIRNPCMEPFETGSLVDLQAHSAPLGLAFYYGKMFPKEYEGNLFVAFHGSWNRAQPTGYKIVRVDMGDLSVHDFATGWLQGVNVIGRPVDVAVSEDGALFVSDDNAGRIYRIYYVI